MAPNLSSARRAARADQKNEVVNAQCIGSRIA